MVHETIDTRSTDEERQMDMDARNRASVREWEANGRQRWYAIRNADIRAKKKDPREAGQQEERDDA